MPKLPVGYSLTEPLTGSPEPRVRVRGRDAAAGPGGGAAPRASVAPPPYFPPGESQDSFPRQYPAPPDQGATGCSGIGGRMGTDLPRLESIIMRDDTDRRAWDGGWGQARGSGVESAAMAQSAPTYTSYPGGIAALPGCPSTVAWSPRSSRRSRVVTDQAASGLRLLVAVLPRAWPHREQCSAGIAAGSLVRV